VGKVEMRKGKKLKKLEGRERKGSGGQFKNGFLT
jgi:hypothetical protein